jgi:hypothetical protein
VPAAAVIPAPIAYVNVVAVKKLVVGSRRVGGGSMFVVLPHWSRDCFGGGRRVLLTECPTAPSGLL